MCIYRRLMLAVFLFALKVLSEMKADNEIF